MNTGLRGLSAPAVLRFDDWIPAPKPWIYSAADSPIFTIDAQHDCDNLIGVGDKIRFYQAGGIRHGIVHAVGSYAGGKTPLTVYCGTDYTPTAGAPIYAPVFSHSRSPYGFPLDDDKWTVSASNTANAHKTPPTQNVWYGGAGLTNTGISIDVLIGAWRGYGKAVLEVEDTTVTDFNIYMTFANANNAESNSDNTGFVALTAPSGTFKVWNVLVMPIKVTVASKTTHYLNIKTSTTTADAIHMRGDVVPTIIKLVDNYL